MFRWLSQTVAVSALSVRTIPQRASSSAVAMIGIAGVVIVFVAVLVDWRRLPGRDGGRRPAGPKPS